MKSEADGSFSDGFRTNVLPHAIAGAHIHIGTIAGKLNGVMPATTPTGWRIEYTSTPVETCSENSPLSSVGIPHANSITSRPRVTSPIASESTLPCSATRSLAISSLSLVHELADAEQHLRAAGERDRSPRAERLLRSLHREVDLVPDARSTAPLWRPVAGLNTGSCDPSVPATVAPPIQWWMGAMPPPFVSAPRSPGAAASSVMSAS